MSKRMRILVLLAMVVLGLVPFATASAGCSDPSYCGEYPCPGPVEYVHLFYSDPQMTNLVGVHWYDCNCEHWFWGTLQGYMREDIYPC